MALILSQQSSPKGAVMLNIENLEAVQKYNILSLR
jgi:hypothetical protein